MVCLHLQSRVPRGTTRIKENALSTPSTDRYRLAPALPVIAVYTRQTFETAVEGFSVPAAPQARGMGGAPQKMNGQVMKRGKVLQHLLPRSPPCALLCSALVLRYSTGQPRLRSARWWDLCPRHRWMLDVYIESRPPRFPL